MRPVSYGLSQAAQVKQLHRYILGKYLKSFLLAISLIIVIVITFDVSENMDDFLHNKAPFRSIVFDYYLNFIPGFVNLYSPLFIFISVIFFTSKMAGNTEVIAILGSGISYRRFLRPYLYGALLLAVVVFVLGNFVIPISSRTQMQFERDYIHTHKMRISHFNNIHFQSEPGTQIYAEFYDAGRRSAQRFLKEVYNDDYQMTERTTADVVEYDTVRKKWEAFNYVHRTLDGGRETLARESRTYTDLGVMPDDFFRAAKIIVTMNTPELCRHIQREKLRGSGLVTEAKIELYKRLLNPLAIVVMTFIGVAVSSRKVRGGIGMHLAIGISLAFGFILFMQVSTVFATNGSLNPFLAVLLPQLVFGVAALVLIYITPK